MRCTSSKSGTRHKVQEEWLGVALGVDHGGLVPEVEEVPCSHKAVAAVVAWPHENEDILLFFWLFTPRAVTWG